VALLDELGNQVAADEAAAADDENLVQHDVPVRGC
jgi:hypothetical protein